MIIFRKGVSVIKVVFTAVILTVATAEEGLENHQQLDRSSARKLSFGESCTAVLRITDDHDNKNSNDTLDCETVDGQLHAVRTPQSFVADKMQDGTLVPGVTKMKLSNAYLDLDSGVVSSESIKLLNSDIETKVDSSVTGTRTMLMVRVIAKDSSTTGTKSQLAASILANKQQLLGCSHNRFLLNPTANRNGVSTNIRDGVVEISLPNTSKSIGNSMVNVITSEINRQFRVSSPSTLANHVMYCLPKGTIGRSYASLPGWRSVMNDNSCLHPGTWIHELGHNLKLHHSNEGNQEYMDTTGLMGNYWYGDDEKMCFNGAKSWQLGWYKERHLEITKSRPRYYGYLSSVLSNPANNGSPIIIKVGPYYITFNAATGMTAGTGEAKNQVTVTKQSRDGDRSYLVAKLGASGTHTITDIEPDCKVKVISVQTTTALVLVEFATKDVRFTAPSLRIRNYAYGAGGWRVERHPRVLADVNGDGKADIVGFGHAGTYVSLSTGSGFSTPSLWIRQYGYVNGWRVEYYPRVLADVNGDGKADIVAFGYSGTYVSLSTGSSFTAPSLKNPKIRNYAYNAGGWRVERHPRDVNDVNGDGKADIVGFGHAGVYVSLSQA